jgi:hypothetical protein
VKKHPCFNGEGNRKMTKQNRMAQIALGTTTAPSTGGWRARLNRAFHRAADNAGYVMNTHFALAASMGIPAVIAIANGVPAGTVALSGAFAVSAAGLAAAGITAGGGVAASLAGVAGVAVVGLAAAAAVAAAGVVAAGGFTVAALIRVAGAGLAAQNKARQDRKSDVDIQKAGWRAAIGTAAGTFAAACMTAGAIHVYGTNMPERAPADAAPKSTCDIKESSGKENIRHNMGKIAVGRAASGAHTLTLPPAAATPPLALAA